MRLKSIKLAGFKSFVDATTVIFPSDLCAVVGPNGCGKSNIIDAVRWVMGESSAKQLRGDSMADVIFNGSTARKPVGQASIELIFDNSDRRITGEYAAYNEISVKRRVMRNGNNDYFLNNSKCRRRDITDIFLGTGLGPRSYSIIEQGMISSLITSKPEELRIYIEEAAGISKYKERRRDTENRIHRTRENLERLTDIRDELQRQLQKLQRQAKAAEKFRQYKSQERTANTQLLALKWQHYESHKQTEQQQQSVATIELEKRLADEAKTNAELEKLRANFSESTQSLSQIQAKFYAESTEISRLEQSIEHNQKRSEQLNQEYSDTQKNITDVTRDLSQDEVKINGWSAEIEQLRLQLEASKKQLEQHQQGQTAAEVEIQKWQQQWENFATELAETEKDTQIQKSSIVHNEQLLKRHLEKIQQLDQSLIAINQSNDQRQLTQQLSQIQAEQKSYASNIDDFQKIIDQAKDSIQTQRQQQISASEALNQTRLKIQQDNGQLASLEALQADFNNNDNLTDEHLNQWLKQNNLQHPIRLYDQLNVESGWETAVEIVLGKCLQAICIDANEDYRQLATSVKSSLALVDQSAAATTESTFNQLPALSTVISGSIPAYLDSIYLVENLEQAWLFQSKLNANQSLITPQGQWVGRNWYIHGDADDAQSGVLKRQQLIESLTLSLKQDSQLESDLLNQLSSIVKAISSAEQSQQQAQQSLNQQIQQRSANTNKATQITSQIEQWQYKQNQLSQEREALQLQIKSEQEQLQQARDIISQQILKFEKLSEDKQKRLKQKQQLEETLKQPRQNTFESGNQYNQLALRERTVQTQLAALKQGQERLQQQHQQSQQRLETLKQQRETDLQPVDQLQKKLESNLKQRLTIETQLNSTRDKTNDIENSITSQQQLLQQLQLKVQQQPFLWHHQCRH